MEGLDKFRKAFADYSENYVVIGGTACEIIMKNTIVRSRATHDIDMVVIIETITTSFVERFWEFIREAGYHPQKKKWTARETPKYELYRFSGDKEGYPKMIELLSRHPDALGNPKGFIIEPLPIDYSISSLSAIIMDNDFYNFTVMHSRITDGIRHADSATLIVLKAKAYLNLLADKQKGKDVNSKDIKKHRSDVLKNVVIMDYSLVAATETILSCINEFVTSIRSDWQALSSPLAKSLGRDEEFVGELLTQLNEMFVLPE